MISSILVAVDESPRAPGVVRMAAELADRFEARMILFRVLGVPPEFPPAGHVTSRDPLLSTLLDRAIVHLEQLAARHSRTRIEPPVIDDREPWISIVAAADRLDVDLIVLGSHRYHGLDYILGTTAGKVANRAHRNVLVVHESETAG